jgi:hypothetical protein
MIDAVEFLAGATLEGAAKATEATVKDKNRVFNKFIMYRVSLKIEIFPFNLLHPTSYFSTL